MKDLITPADFTLFIREIPKHVTKSDIEEWVQKNGVPKNMEKPQIYNISLIYDSRKFIEYEEEYLYWRTEYEHDPPEEGTLLQPSKGK